MKTKQHLFDKTLTRLILMLFAGLILMLDGKTLSAQELKEYRFTINEAIGFAKTRNKRVQGATTEQQAAQADLKDIRNGALPLINLNGSYQRFSDLTLFENGLSSANSSKRKPTSNSAALGTEASLNIYSGGKQHWAENEYSAKLAIAGINTNDQAANIALQTAGNYLELIRLNQQQGFISDQLKRAEVRLKNIQSLYKNQKVTKSDLLRAEVALSNVKLSLEQNQGDIEIANQRMDVLLDLPDNVKISLADSAGMSRAEMASVLSVLGDNPGGSFVLQRATKVIDMQKQRIKGIMSASRPTISLFGAYGLNYPNYLFFPPVDQAYAIGFLGVKAQYNISSLYQNRQKIAAGKLRLKELEIQRSEYADNIRIELGAYFIKYRESLSRISVNEKSVEQARVNYEIVNKKYLNQLALLTDLLEADNLYQESRFNLVRAQTDAFGIYYRILYTSGKL